MSRQNKLLERLLSRPSDFTWQELCKLLNGFGFEVLKGKGSRRKFLHRATQQLIIVHEPHPQNIVKEYIIKDVIIKLTEMGHIK